MILSEKNKLRQEMKEKRRLFIKHHGPPTLKKYTSSYIDFFLETFNPKPPFGVAGYWPIQEEVDCRPLLRLLCEQNLVCSLPCIQNSQSPLIFKQWTPESPLNPCRAFPKNLGLMEPIPTSLCVTPQIILIPTLGFDTDGHRLGYGGGFYDRTLRLLRASPQTPIVAVGLSYACQKISDLPHEPHDEKLDWIITEKKIYKTPFPK